MTRLAEGPRNVFFLAVLRPFKPTAVAINFKIFPKYSTYFVIFPNSSTFSGNFWLKFPRPPEDGNFSTLWQLRRHVKFYNLVQQGGYNRGAW